MTVMVMALAGDSSGRLPDESHESIRSLEETAEERRERLLTSCRFRASIAKVARSRGVPECDVDDVIQETLGRALRADLPASDEEALRYTNGIAVHVVRAHIEELAAEATDPYEESDDDGLIPTPVSAQPASFEDRDALRTLLDHGLERFPRTFPWFLRARLFDETSDAIASEHRVQASHVRHEISVVQSYLHTFGQRMGLALTLLVLVVAGVFAWMRRPFELWNAPTYANHRVAPPALTATQLRERARQAYRRGAYDACLADLDAADWLDPDGRNVTIEVPSERDEHEIVDLRAAAETRARPRSRPWPHGK
jgi:hypothetical protein